ncbi:MAG: helix-turn-helix transcriptional regulator [Bacteroidota bacterium]
MMTLIDQIMRCDRTGHFKRMFLESHVIELLMLQLEQISDHSGDTFSNVSKHREKLYAVKEILSRQLVGDLTLNSLAQQVGTNEFTLKKGFKELFGTSVFGYWNQIKMQEARKLLSEGTMSVKEVSARVGYKNAQHFSTAFKKYFGCSPSELK